MNDEKVEDINNSDTILDNTLINNSSSDIENSAIEDKESSSVLAYDYYDRYYDNVLSKLTSIEENQQVIIYNQEQMQVSFENGNKVLHEDGYLITILFSMFFIYFLVRNMLER